MLKQSSSDMTKISNVWKIKYHAIITFLIKASTKIYIHQRFEWRLWTSFIFLHHHQGVGKNIINGSRKS